MKKRFLALALAAMTAFSMAACGSSASSETSSDAAADTSTDASASTDTASSDTSTDASASSSGRTLDEIKEGFLHRVVVRSRQYRMLQDVEDSGIIPGKRLEGG